MEPENAVAHVTEGACEIWASVQTPDWAVTQVAEYLNIAPENAKVHLIFLSGGFGRNTYLVFLMEAVCLSKQVKAPVKLLWSPENDTLQGPFRPGMLSAMRGGVDKNGNVVAFEHKIVGASIQHQLRLFGAKALTEKDVDEWAMECIKPEGSSYKFASSSYWPKLKFRSCSGVRCIDLPKPSGTSAL
jgi:isoquinoline 1-oxidoreductase subunit beta